MIIATCSSFEVNDVGLVVDVVVHPTGLVHHEQRIGAGFIEGAVVLITLHLSPVGSGLSQVHDGQVITSHEGSGFDGGDGGRHGKYTIDRG